MAIRGGCARPFIGPVQHYDLRRTGGLVQRTGDREAISDAAQLRRAPRQRLLWAYGLGDAGTGMAASLIGFYLFVFYTAAAGLR
ncbi:hypothetical protein SYNGFB01_12155, partial [Synechococcus sp. GFB01]